MKKIIIKILLILSVFGLVFTSAYAEGDSAGGSDTIKVTVTEKIPGASCTPEDSSNACDENGNCEYTCEVEKGFGSVVKMLGGIIKYFTFLAGLGGVLYIVINGIMYSMGGIDQSMKDEAKKRVQKTLIGLVLLFLSGVVLNIIAPWIYK